MAYVVHKAERIEINDTLTIGRAPSNDLVFDEITVSRNHAIIKKIGQKYYVIDLGSSNGTYKDGHKIESPYQLENKSLIQCGNKQIVFYDNVERSNDEQTQIAFTSSFVLESIILVADIRGYTEFSESVPLKNMSHMMASWYKQVTKIIDEANGHIDSFIGDCIYARWDELIDIQTANIAIDAAKKINTLTKELSLKASDGQKELQVGAAVHLGEVIVGADTRNTGLGDAVNVAFRLESMTRELETDILLSEDICIMLNKHEECIEVQLKGKNKIQKVCKVFFDE